MVNFDPHPSHTGADGGTFCGKPIGRGIGNTMALTLDLLMQEKATEGLLKESPRLEAGGLPAALALNCCAGVRVIDRERNGVNWAAYSNEPVFALGR
jgi:hypothetical protein